MVSSVVVLVPYGTITTGNPPGNEETNAQNIQNYFARLIQENQQINVFPNNYSLEHGVEEQAEAKHTAVLDLIYNEVRSLEAHADAVHANRLAFVRHSHEVLVSHFNTKINAYRAETQQFQSRLLRSETDCHEESQHSSEPVSTRIVNSFMDTWGKNLN